MSLFLLLSSHHSLTTHPPSVRYQIITEIARRLELISMPSGYNTNAGALVFFGETPTLGPSDPEQALALVVRGDLVGYQGANVVTTLPIEVQALAKIDTGPTVIVEQIIDDIKRAIESDHSLGGLLLPRGLIRGITVPLEREPGSQFVGASVGYNMMFAEKWGGG